MLAQQEIKAFKYRNPISWNKGCQVKHRFPITFAFQISSEYMFRVSMSQDIFEIYSPFKNDSLCIWDSNLVGQPVFLSVKSDNSPRIRTKYIRTSQKIWHESGVHVRLRDIANMVKIIIIIAKDWNIKISEKLPWFTWDQLDRYLNSNIWGKYLLCV